MSADERDARYKWEEDDDMEVVEVGKGEVLDFSKVRTEQKPEDEER